MLMLRRVLFFRDERRFVILHCIFGSAFCPMSARRISCGLLRREMVCAPAVAADSIHCVCAPELGLRLSARVACLEAADPVAELSDPVRDDRRSVQPWSRNAVGVTCEIHVSPVGVAASKEPVIEAEGGVPAAPAVAGTGGDGDVHAVAEAGRTPVELREAVAPADGAGVSSATDPARAVEGAPGNAAAPAAEARSADAPAVDVQTGSGEGPAPRGSAGTGGAAVTVSMDVADVSDVAVAVADDTCAETMAPSMRDRLADAALRLANFGQEEGGFVYEAVRGEVRRRASRRCLS